MRVLKLMSKRHGGKLDGSIVNDVASAGKGWLPRFLLFFLLLLFVLRFKGLQVQQVFRKWDWVLNSADQAANDESVVGIAEREIYRVDARGRDRTSGRFKTR